MKDFEKRIQIDRRNHPTPGLSRYILSGKRKELRRSIDQEKGGYVDRYSSGLFIILVSIVSLNVLDSLLTMMILEQGGWELNPIVQSVMDLCGEKFWVWKFAMVSLCVVLLCLHSRFKRVMADREWVSLSGGNSLSDCPDRLSITGKWNLEPFSTIETRKLQFDPTVIVSIWAD